MPTAIGNLPKIRSLRELIQTEGEGGLDRYFTTPVRLRNKSKKPFGSPQEYRDANTGLMEFTKPCAVVNKYNYWLAPAGTQGDSRLVPIQVVYVLLGNPVDDDPQGLIRATEHARLRLRYGAVDHMATQDIQLHRLYANEGLGEYYPLPDLKGDIPDLEVVDPDTGEVIDAAWPLYESDWLEPSVDVQAVASQVAAVGEERITKLEMAMARLIEEAERQGVVLLEPPEGD